VPRTTNEAVKGILGSNWNGTSSLTPFVASASALVDRVADCAVKKGYPLSAVELDQIETWLAAHLYCQMDLLYQSKNTNRASATFQGQTGLSLDSTRYGQTAMNLDFSGCLSAIGKRQFASLAWLGKPPSQQVPVTQRD